MQVLIDRIRAEYLEMPGMTLTLAQASRLCGIEPLMCAAVLKTLVDMQFLCTTPDGSYARVTNDSMRRPRPAKATLESSSVKVRQRVS